METKELIKKALSENHPVSDIYLALGNKGLSVQDIDEAFAQVMQERAASQVFPAQPTTPAPTPVPPMPPQNEGHKFNLTKAFILIGGIFIVIAIIIVIFSSWAALGPIGRILMLFAPMAALFTIYFVLRKNENYKDISMAALMLSLFTLPLFLGTVLYQTDIIPQIGANLFLTTALLSVPFFVLAEYFLKNYYISAYTVASVLVAVSALCSILSLEFIPSLWVVTFVGLIITAIGAFLANMKAESDKIYFGFGALFTLFMFMVSTLATINDYSTKTLTTNCLLIFGFGLFYMTLAGGIYQLYKSTQSNVYYFTKRVIEEVSPAIMIFSLALAGTENAFFIVLALALSGLAIFMSTKIALKALVWIGVLGLIVSTLQLTGKYFADSIGWPIILLVAGLSFFGLAFLVKKLLKERNLPSIPVLGIGVDAELENSAKHVRASVLRILIFIAIMAIVFPLVAYMIIRIAFIGAGPEVF